VVTVVFCLGVGFVLFLAWIGVDLLRPGCGGRGPSRRAQCKSQLKQLGLALHNNHDVDKFFPPGSTSKASWQAYLLPFVDRKDLHDHLDPRNGTTPVSNTTSIAVFLCPSNVAASTLDGETTYLASGGRQFPREPTDSALRGVFRDQSVDREGRLKENVTDPSDASYRGWSWRGNYFTFRDNTDGTSTTIALGETARGRIAWAAPFAVSNPTIGWTNRTGDGGHINAVVLPGTPPLRALFSSDHPGGAQFVFVDGAVVFLNERMAPAAFEAMLTIRGGEDDVNLPN
jgi:prepilin-type processing-associated H-X9-DG protein